MLLQNPFEFAASDAAAKQAVASLLSHAPARDAAATLFDSGAMPLPPDEAAASPGLQASDAAADILDLGTDCIGEIFAGARKLFDPDPAAYTSADEAYYDLLRQLDDPHTADLIDIPAGMWLEFDPPPLFLQASGF